MEHKGSKDIHFITNRVYRLSSNTTWCNSINIKHKNDETSSKDLMKGHQRRHFTELKRLFVSEKYEHEYEFYYGQALCLKSTPTDLLLE